MLSDLFYFVLQLFLLHRDIVRCILINTLHFLRESPVNGCFYFTGKRIELFCKDLQKVSHKIAQKMLKQGTTLPFCKQPG